MVQVQRTLNPSERKKKRRRKKKKKTSFVLAQSISNTPPGVPRLFVSEMRQLGIANQIRKRKKKSSPPIRSSRSDVGPSTSEAEPAGAVEEITTALPPYFWRQCR